MKYGRGYEVTVLEKVKDDIYWGRTENLDIKFSSNENLVEGEKHFVHHTEVIGERPLRRNLKNYSKKG